jgi:hypothetical protein
VTIAAGQICSNGIVIAADGEITHTLVKTQKVKLFECQGISEQVAIIGGGAGDELFVDAVVEKLREQLDIATPDLVSIKREIEKIVLQACQDAWPLYESNNRPDLQLLIAIKAVDGLGLLEVNGPLVRNVSEFGSIGFGTDLAIYKSKHLFMPRMPIELAAPIMVHLVKTVKDNARYCGGKTSVWVLLQDGTIDVKTEEYIERAEVAYEALDMGISLISFALPILRGADGKLIMDHLVQTLKTYPNSRELVFEQARAAMDAMVKGLQPKQLEDGTPKNEG